MAALTEDRVILVMASKVQHKVQYIHIHVCCEVLVYNMVLANIVQCHLLDFVF